MAESSQRDADIVNVDPYVHYMAMPLPMGMPVSKADVWYNICPAKLSNAIAFEDATYRYAEDQLP